MNGKLEGKEGERKGGKWKINPTEQKFWLC